MSQIITVGDSTVIMSILSWIW